MHTAGTQPPSGRDYTWQRSIVSAGLALIIAATLVATLRLDSASRAQRVHVRYDDTISNPARQALEEQLGLTGGIELESGTWSYLLTKRSRRDIQAIVSAPGIRDTHHIDRDAYRVLLDRPDLPTSVRWFAEAGWTLWLAGLLALTVIVLLRRAAPVLLAIGRFATLDLASAVSSPPSPRTHRVLLVLTALALALTLPLAVEPRPDEAMFVHLYETPSLLDGDHPYRDFFEWGAPLPALLSAAVQAVVGYRVIGELLLQWTLIIAGVVIAVHLALRHASSTGSVIAVLPITVLLGVRSGYHFSKIFCIPLSILAAWRYIDSPTRGRAAMMGVCTAVAFLFRHDLAAWGALASVLALIAPIVESPLARTVGRFATHTSVYAAVVVVALLPWAVLVSTGDGLPSYVAARAERLRYGRGAGNVNPYSTITDINPFRQLTPVRLPEPQPGSISFSWEDDVSPERVAQLEAHHGLHQVDGSSPGRRYYQVSNVYDIRLLPLRDYVRDDTGIAWDLLEAASRGEPAQESLVQWLARLTMIVPIALLVSGVVEARSRQGKEGARRHLGMQRALAAIVVCGACVTLLREWGYFIVVAPVTAALSSAFLTRQRPAEPTHAPAFERVRRSLVFVVAVLLLALTTYAAAVWHRPLWKGSVAETIRQLPLSAEVWTAAEPDAGNPIYAYIRECTDPGDRLLITGSTPYYVPYYTHRAMAGGHLDWSLGLLSGAEDEARSLALLRQQAVPLVVGRGDHVLEEFNRYPQIRAYIARYYAEVPGSNGWLLYDTRRPVIRTYGPSQFPCFRTSSMLDSVNRS